MSFRNFNKKILNKKYKIIFLYLKKGDKPPGIQMQRRLYQDEVIIFQLYNNNDTLQPMYFGYRDGILIAELIKFEGSVHFNNILINIRKRGEYKTLGGSIVFKSPVVDNAYNSLRQNTNILHNTIFKEYILEKGKFYGNIDKLIKRYERYYKTEQSKSEKESYMVKM